MRCFIATPLGHKDVDLVYDKAIRPVLKSLNLKSSRIDRVVHNDDIDNKIFQLLDQSALCIADLTYARPSVYYEAGYTTASNKPVIYIARSDHFEPKSSDPNGNLKVHFDLQMKNIIPWIKPNKTFKQRLYRRLLHALKPLKTLE